MTEENPNQSAADVEFSEAFDSANTEPEDTVVQDDQPAEQPDDMPNEQLQEEPEKQEAQEGQAEQEDPLAGLSESQRAYVDAIRKEKEALAHKYESDRGRFLAAQRVLQQVHQEKKEQAPPKQQQAAPASIDPDKLKAFERDYPEIAEVLSARDSQLRDQVKREIESEVRPTLESLRQKAAAREVESQQAAIQAEFKRLDAAHSDWADIARSDGFKAWAQRQPKPVQQVIAKSYQADEISAVLTYYKAERAVAQRSTTAATPQPTTPARDQRLERSRTTSPRVSQSKLEGTLPKNDFDAVFNAIT